MKRLYLNRFAFSNNKVLFNRLLLRCRLKKDKESENENIGSWKTSRNPEVVTAFIDSNCV